MAIRMDGGGQSGISLESWRELAAKGQAQSGQVHIRKQYVAEEIKEVNGEDRTLSFTVSTGAVDRDLDTISAEGWRLDAFLKNPVVLWAHSYSSLPLAKAVSVEQGDGRLRAKAKFADHPFADTVYQMLKDGFLKATSVGFRPLKWVYNEERRGVDFTEQELLEFSIVPVPANPEALMEAAAKGIDVGPILEWAESIVAKSGREPNAKVLKEISAIRALLERSKDDHGDECPMGGECPMWGKTLKPQTLPPENGSCPAGYDMGEDGMCHEKAAAGPAKIQEPVEKVLWLDNGDGQPRFLVDPAAVQEAWAEVLSGYARSAIGALKGRVD